MLARRPIVHLASSYSSSPLRCPPRLLAIRPAFAPRARRVYSSSSPSSSTPSSEPPNNRQTFAQTFMRPVAKTFLVAVFTYQLAYFAWTKLALDEERGQLQAKAAELNEKRKSKS
ncbi:hypothetical protein GGR56DRAFT_677842 [Xylariaceae sp. FL0804]|nr:hypothetical protein GGR56DRAFT_677842 [Xylariaceae sp. FL0804]